MIEIALTCPRSLPDPDVALVRQIAGGEEEALRSLYGKQSQRLFAYAYRVTGNRPVAEEVMQDSVPLRWAQRRRLRQRPADATQSRGRLHVADAIGRQGGVDRARLLGRGVQASR